MTEGTALAPRLAAFAGDARRRGLGPELSDQVQARITDILGLQLAAKSLDSSVAVECFVREQGGVAQATITGSAGRVPMAWSAFANGVLAHSLDYDDTHLPSILHPSASVVPAALSVGEAASAGGQQVAVAIAVGLEITVRLGMAGYDEAARSNVYFDHGQHATSICGTVGSAAAAALLLDLNEDEIGHAIAVAASMASGIIEANRTGGTVKRVHCGWAAHAGVTAACLARAGITGPPSALEGRFGLFEAFLHGNVNLLAVTDGLGSRWEMSKIFFKPYPANHYTHAGIDAALRLRERGIAAGDVRRVTLGVPAAIVRTIGEPLALKQNPPTGYAAQFSGPYTVAAALVGGSGLGLGLDDFRDDRVSDRTLRDLMAKVVVVGDERCDGIYPHQFPAFLRVELGSGDVVEEAVTVNRGGPANPLTKQELARKFADNARRSLPADRVEHLRRTLDRFAELPDVGALMAATHGSELAAVDTSWGRE